MVYDEFAYFADNAAEVGLAWHGPPVVARRRVPAAPGRELSALVWGTAEPEVALLHGSAQNAHTFDTVALALDRPLVAIDLPGHGHSDAEGRSASGRSSSMAADVAVALRALAPAAHTLVGMSLGGLVALAVAGTAPQLVRRLVLVDVTPGVTAAKAASITAFVAGPATFPSFDELLARTVEYNPTRSESSLRRGILHNAEELPDGTWRWRYRRHDPPAGAAAENPAALWDVLAALDVPVILVRGTRPGSVVDDADEARFNATARRPTVVHVDAGHSIQGDAPLQLANIISTPAP